MELQRPLPLLAWMWAQLVGAPCVQRSYRADTREKSRKIPRNGGRASSEKGSLDLEGAEQTLVSFLLPKFKRDPNSSSCTGFKVAEGPLQVSDSDNAPYHFFILERQFKLNTRCGRKNKMRLLIWGAAKAG